MIDSVEYAIEQFKIRKREIVSLEYRMLVFEEDTSYLILNAHNGSIFFKVITLPNDTLITGDNNAMIVNEEQNGLFVAEFIEEFSGQVIIELPFPAERNTIFQFLQVNLV